MAYFRGQKVESSAEVEERCEQLRTISQSILNDCELDEQNWLYFLAKADCLDLFEIGKSMLHLDTSELENRLTKLEEFSSDCDWNIRDSVARVLAAIPEKKSELLLLRLVFDEETLVRHAAFQALCKINHDFTNAEKEKLLCDPSKMVSEQAKQFFC